MNRFLEEARAISDEIIENRRHIHTNAECGLQLPETVRFVLEKLKSYGCDPKPLGDGIVCLIGKGPQVLLLRADMDALPQKEDSGLPYACTDGACHSCGHDGHTAMLLGAAKILKAHEKELCGTVKLMFQPGEETLRGAKQMVDAGILEGPKVQAAMALHMNFGPCGYEPKTGMLTYTKAMSSADEFQITVKGKSAHGSTPYLGCSALSAAANIVVAVQQILALEVACDEPSVISFGMMQSGSVSNIIADKAVLLGSIRAFSRDNRNHLKERLVQLAQTAAAAWGAEAEVQFLTGVGPNANDEKLSEEMLQYCGEIAERVQQLPNIKGSEDFAVLGEYVPTFFANICAGGPADGYLYSMHHPKASFDENALPYGTAVLCNCAYHWLKKHSLRKTDV